MATCAVLSEFQGFVNFQAIIAPDTIRLIRSVSLYKFILPTHKTIHMNYIWLRTSYFQNVHHQIQ
jgi:hypothetical protein